MSHGVVGVDAERVRGMRQAYGMEALEGLTKFLFELGGAGFYGSVEIQYQGGEIVLVRKMESFKPAVFVVEK